MIQRVKSLSEKRLIVEVEVNGKAACLLIDTGACVGIMDDNQVKKYGLVKGMKYAGTLTGIGGEMKGVRVCNTFAYLRGRMIPQFLLADISAIVESIEKETGIEILGIVSLPQMRMCRLGVDADDMEIIVEY